MLDKYHHGDLRAAVLAAAAEVIARDGVDQLNLRSLTAEIGVSHTAPRHHFGSREGVFTALACEGYDLLADALEDAAANGDFAAVGVAYVLFAVQNPGHFAVMHRPDLVDGSNTDLQRAQQRTAAPLEAGARDQRGESAEEIAVASIAALSLVHGLATLQLSGALADAGLLQQAGGDLPSIALRAVRQLFGGAASGEPTHRTES